MPAMKLTCPVFVALGLLLGLCMLQCTGAKRAAGTRPAPTLDLPGKYSQAVSAGCEQAVGIGRFKRLTYIHIVSISCVALGLQARRTPRSRRS